MKDKTFAAISTFILISLLIIIASVTFMESPTAMSVKEIEGKPTVFGAIILIASLAALICHLTWRKR